MRIASERRQAMRARIFAARVALCNKRKHVLDI